MPFFAMKGDDVVGHATVDVDPDPSKVCHLRMLLVAPQMQRQGVGIAMLKAIVTAMPKRDLGLKYAKCHDYHATRTLASGASAMTNFTCTWPCADRNDSRTVYQPKSEPMRWIY